jgi:hypothetical protein
VDRKRRRTISGSEERKRRRKEEEKNRPREPFTWAMGEWASRAWIRDSEEKKRREVEKNGEEGRFWRRRKVGDGVQRRRLAKN